MSKRKADPVAPAPSDAPALGSLVVLWENGSSTAATVAAVDEHGTLTLDTELFLRPVRLTGVQRRQGDGNGWEPLAEAER